MRADKLWGYAQLARLWGRSLVIAAALVATVAGLVVAIPALFGYNYLGSKIKNITADMHVFVDEFLSRIAESHS